MAAAAMLNCTGSSARQEWSMKTMMSKQGIWFIYLKPFLKYRVVFLFSVTALPSSDLLDCIHSNTGPHTKTVWSLILCH